MDISIRFMHLDHLAPGVKVHYEDREGGRHTAVIVRKERGLWARTQQADGSLSEEHRIYATNITQIIPD